MFYKLFSSKGGFRFVPFKVMLFFIQSPKEPLMLSQSLSPMRCVLTKGKRKKTESRNVLI